MKKILVVEDDKNTNEVIHDFLIDAGYEVYPAFNGQKALEQFLSELELRKLLPLREEMN